MKKILFVLSLLVFVSGYGRLFASGAISHGGDIVYTKPVKSVIFSHKLHAEDRGLSCGMCHSGLFDAVALKAQQKNDFNMDSLYKGKYCGSCHNGQMAFASNTQCARCHAGVKGHAVHEKKGPVKSPASGPEGLLILGKGDSFVKFSHAKHAASLICGDCHSGVFPMSRDKTKVTMEGIYQGESCGSCHNGKNAFSSYECKKCHEKTPAPAVDLTYKNKGTGAVKFSHEFHKSAFKCDECHKNLFAMRKGGSRMKMDAMYNGRFCGSCHNGNTASNVTDCGKCHKG
ncbi:MAG: hypothetical protein C4560_01885 [Nitrospiraceae bacterium]|nr:MAG: hypothetical protein C4560_01885 [Nitrospiraceae bacterium]